MSKTPVILIQDGAVDELMSIFLLQSEQEKIDLLGVVILNADCLGQPTLEVTRKILRVIGTPEVPVTISQSRAVNAFPWSYRQYSMMVNLLPLLNLVPYTKTTESRTAAAMIVDNINDARSQGKPKVTILGLSSLSPLLDAYKIDPTIKEYIGQIVWMGGALEPADYSTCQYPFGNVDPGLAPGANANAEWNAYWDPFAVAEVWETFKDIAFVEFPLNATNKVMLDSKFILELAPLSREYPAYALAAQMYAMVAFEAGYAFWDTVTTAYLTRKDLFKQVPKTLAIKTAGTDQGTISEVDGGAPVQVVTEVNVDEFYKYLKTQWKMPLPGLGS
ncbi:MAG: hypothetical protein GY765_02430 [bacterium]|nr:hypothetical protein [bacterium]